MLFDLKNLLFHEENYLVVPISCEYKRTMQSNKKKEKNISLTKENVLVITNIMSKISNLNVRQINFSNYSF